MLRLDEETDEEIQKRREKMIFSELRKTEIRKPFTVGSLFDENFYVNFKNIYEKESLVDDIIVEGNTYILSSLENDEFIFEEMDEDKINGTKEKIDSLFETERKMILITTGFSEDNAICESVMTDEKDRVLMCAYIKTMFEIFLKSYDFKCDFSIFHAEQINGEYVELPHVHIIISCEKDNGKMEKFNEDFRDNIFDE